MAKKKTAVVLFPHFCNYEIAILLEILSLNKKPVTFFASSPSPCRSEEGLQVLPDMTYKECEIGEYDSLVISGSYVEGQYVNFADHDLHDLIRLFDESKKLIAAISSGPMVLCKAGIMHEKQFIAGVKREWYLKDPKMALTAEQMAGLIDVDDLQSMSAKGKTTPAYLADGHILTAPGWKFREWALAFGRTLELEVWPRAYGDDLY